MCINYKETFFLFVLNREISLWTVALYMFGIMKIIPNIYLSDIANIQSFIQVSQDLISLGCYELAEMKAFHFFCHMARPESFRWAGSELYLQAEEEIFNEKKHTATGLKTKGFLKII